MGKFCQSCGMPLTLDGKDIRGTEVNGTPSPKYCSYCYRDGQFIEPDITFDEMLVRGKKGIFEGKGNFIMKSFMSWGYPFQLKKLERWKTNSIQ